LSGPTVEIACIILRETDNAVLIDEGGEEVWLPLSTVEEIHRNAKGEGSIVVQE